MSSGCNLDLHIPPKRKFFFFFFFARVWKRKNWVLSLRIMAVWQIREKSLWSCTTTTPHANGKVWVELTVFFKTRTLGHFPNKYHSCCTFRYFWGGGRCSFSSWLLKIRKDLCRVACFCLMYIYISYFWWNYIHSLFFFWYILLWIPARLELAFLFLKKEFTLSVFSVFSFKESIDFGTSRKIILWKNNQRANWVDFDGKNHAFPIW